MRKSTQLKRQPKEPQFVKGMTLTQYLASFTEQPMLQAEEKDQGQENLFQSSHCGGRKALQSKNKESRIQEIDQESVQDSVQYNKPSRARGTPVFKEIDLLISETSEENLLFSKNPRDKVNSLSIHARQNMKGISLQKNSFRVKKMSMSPAKKKTEEVLVNGSITLYGSKFGQVAKREETKMSELLTFYGKLSLDKQQAKIKQKTSLKVGDMKNSFKKKNSLELKELLMMQNRIKSNYRSAIAKQEMIVVGKKDRLNERKQRQIQ